MKRTTENTVMNIYYLRAVSLVLQWDSLEEPLRNDVLGHNI